MRTRRGRTINRRQLIRRFTVEVGPAPPGPGCKRGTVLCYTPHYTPKITPRESCRKSPFLLTL
jgi:hypothetical protein